MNTTELFKTRMAGEVSRLLNFYWLKKRNWKVSIPLDVFGDVYMLIKDSLPEDVRKAGLCCVYGFDVYAIKVKPTFAETIEANADWMQISNDRYFFPKIGKIQ